MALNIKVSRQDFQAALTPMQNICSRKGTMAILTNVLVETGNDSVTLSATDLELSVRTETAAEIMEPGAITMPARTLFALVRECDSDTITIEETENSKVSIKANNSTFTISGMPADDFPEFPDHAAAMVDFASETIQEMIDKTIFSVATEGDSQFTLSGILVEREEKDDGDYLRLVSSDGHRLSLIEKKSETPLAGIDFSSQIIVPRRGFQEVKKLCETVPEIAIGVNRASRNGVVDSDETASKQMVVRGGDTVIVIRLIDGSAFPDYRSIISMIERNNCMQVNRDQLLASLKRTIIFSEEKFHMIRFEISGERLDLFSEEADKGKADEHVNISYVGDNMTIGFNGRYFIEVLNVMDSDIVRVYVNSTENPCVVEGDDDEGFLSIIMPMNIS